MNRNNIFFLLCFLAFALSGRAQKLERNTIQDNAGILEGYETLLQSEMDYFEDRTGVPVYVVTSYDLENQELNKIVRRWADGENEAILLSLNPINLLKGAAPDWTENFVLSASRRVEKAAYLSEAVRANLIHDHGIPALEAVTISDNQQFFEAFRNVLAQAQFILDPPPYQFGGFVINDFQDFEFGNPQIIVCGSDSIIRVEVKERLGRDLPDNLVWARFPSTIEIDYHWESLNRENIYGEEVGKYYIDINGATLKGELAEIGIDFWEHEFDQTKWPAVREFRTDQFVITSMNVGFDKELYRVNEGRREPAADIHYTVKPPDMSVRFSILPAGDETPESVLLGDYTHHLDFVINTRKNGADNFPWEPFYGESPLPAGLNDIYVQPMGDDETLTPCRTGSQIEIIKQGQISNFKVTHHSKDEAGNYMSRTAYAGDTLWLVKGAMTERKNVEISFDKDVDDFFIGEPIWTESNGTPNYLNTCNEADCISDFGWTPHGMNKLKRNSASQFSYAYNKVPLSVVDVLFPEKPNLLSSSHERIGVEAFGQTEWVHIIQLTSKLTKYKVRWAKQNNALRWTRPLIESKDLAEKVSGYISKIAKAVPVVKLESRTGIDITAEQKFVELPNSPKIVKQVTFNFAGWGSISKRIVWGIPPEMIPDYVKKYVNVEGGLFIEPGLELKVFGGPTVIFPETGYEVLYTTVGGKITGFLKAGAYFSARAGSTETYIGLKAEAFARAEASGELSKRSSEPFYRLTSNIGKLSLGALIELNGAFWGNEFQVVAWNFDYVVFDGWTFEDRIYP